MKLFITGNVFLLSLAFGITYAQTSMENEGANEIKTPVLQITDPQKESDCYCDVRKQQQVKLRLKKLENSKTEINQSPSETVKQTETGQASSTPN